MANAKFGFDPEKAKRNKTKCKDANIKITVTAATNDLTPRELTLRHEDKVCFTFQTEDEPKKLFLVAGLPEELVVDDPSQLDYLFTSFPKVGDISAKCTGCSDLDNPAMTIHVLSKEEFDAKLKISNEAESLKLKRR